MDRRQFIGAAGLAGIALTGSEAVAQGRRVGRSDVERFRQRVADLRRLDDFSGGSSVFPLVEDEIGTLSSLASRGSYTEEVGRELLSALGELYQFASWTAFDAGRLEQARQLALMAANAANQAGDRTLGATALSELSYLTASSDQPAEGMAMARASLANAPLDVLPAVRVVLADRLAWACARVGDARGVDHALGVSEDAHDRRDARAVEEPDTVYWINRDESQIMAGRCWAELRRPEKAVPILETLTAPYDDTHAREVALYSCWLASAYLDAGEIDAATTTARRAVQLSRNTASPRTDTVLMTTLAAFDPHIDVPEVNELFQM
ncbi:XRE family transcriptional regulator [Streptomyces sp. NBC_01803]|uniref:XRE family transcriptional regulator n=1 Tax=Streptomyces sp. NBC_01803 TaxID=2975946 RepID=UPI002DD9B839|nr:XRE family transcriptional regulator [Streptomyces sp. NBC_01803]WSA43728.1 XRE family transcriptional regulator [Streptomyces sp. NBC_01803]